jgi:YHS domain-containing protein
MNAKTKLLLTAVLAIAALSFSPQAVKAEGVEGSHGMMADQKQTGVGIDGFCPVCVIKGKMMKGSDNFVTEYKGVIYKFPSMAQQKMFLDNPEEYTANLQAKYEALKSKDAGSDKKMMEGSH